MDRGFGSTLRGPGFGGSNNTGYRHTTDTRYDDFYSDNRRGGGRNNSSGGASGSNNRNRNTGDWGGSNRDRGFFNQEAQGNAGRNRGNVNGQMLAALQQQQNLLTAFMSSQSRGLLPAPLGHSSFGGQRGGGKFGGGGRYGGRPGDKRKPESVNPSGFNKRSRKQPRRSSEANKGNQRTKAPEKQKEKIEEEVPDIPDDEVEIPDTLMDSVEKLRQQTDVERNVADEDILKLKVFSFNGKGYHCLTCNINLMKESGFHQHLMGKPHVMNVIDARTAKKYQETRDILDIDLSPDDWYEQNEKARAIILKQAKMFMKTQMEIKKHSIDNYNRNPGNFFTVDMEEVKAAMKHDDTITFKLLMESTLQVKDFVGDKFFGFEFIKPVSKFTCRLCGLDIKDASSVIAHVESRLHKNNYQFHLKQNKDYEKTHQERNKDLSEVLAKHEDNFVLLAESPKSSSSKFLSEAGASLIRVPDLIAEKEEKTHHEKKADATVEVVKEDEASEPADAGAANVVMDSDDAPEAVLVKTGDIEEDIQPEVAKDDGDDDPVEEEIAEDDLEVKQETEEDHCDEEEVVEREDEKPEAPVTTAKAKKSILKKPSPARVRGGIAKRGGRGRGKAKKVMDVDTAEQDDSNDGSFMEAFHVVDEVEEE